jgi:hypothetical protein
MVPSREERRRGGSIPGGWEQGRRLFPRPTLQTIVDHAPQRKPYGAGIHVAMPQSGLGLATVQNGLDPLPR